MLSENLKVLRKQKGLSQEELAEQLETVTLEQVVEMANKLELDTIYFLKGKEA